MINPSYTSFEKWRKELVQRVSHPALAISSKYFGNELIHISWQNHQQDH
jgi:hypothetical protein